jgi:protease YdgD
MRILLGAIASFALVGAAEAACPDWQLDPAFGSVTLEGGFTPDPHMVEIPSGGEIDLSTCAEVPGGGWVATAPDYDLTYNGSNTLTFTIVPDDDTDTILLINGPTGEWYYDDDSGFAFNPLITIPNAPSGLYDIWVGNYSQGDSKDTRLLVTERD